MAFKIRIDEISGIAKLAQDKSEDHAKIACEFLASRYQPSPLSFLGELLDDEVK
jgi:hypothetical protein